MNADTSSLDAGKREMLRHTLATVAYRGRKDVSGVPDGFSSFSVNATSRTPGQILAHICDLYDWANWLARGEQKYAQSEPADWSSDVARFFAAIAKLDEYLASDAPLGRPAEILFQGPIADSLTHFGQIAFLRRIAGAPVKGESYARAEITAG
jgi:hypothetical protein